MEAVMNRAQRAARYFGLDYSDIDENPDGLVQKIAFRFVWGGRRPTSLGDHLLGFSRLVAMALAAGMLVGLIT
jgi:hypothetical protein